jgi:hypothetical protein
MAPRAWVRAGVARGVGLRLFDFGGFFRPDTGKVALLILVEDCNFAHGYGKKTAITA